MTRMVISETTLSPVFLDDPRTDADIHHENPECPYEAHLPPNGLVLATCPSGECDVLLHVGLAALEDCEFLHECMSPPC